MRVMLISLALAVIAVPSTAQTAADSAGVRTAALDYIEGWWMGDADRMSRAVHPKLAKRFVFKEDNGESGFGHTTAEGLVESTRRGRGTGLPAEERQSDVTVLDIYGDIATVKLSSTGLVDYLHLVRWNGEWKIVNVLWAPGPEAPTRVAPSDSVAAQRLTDLVEVINSGSGARMRSHFETAFILSPDQLERGTLERMVAFFSSTYDRSRGFKVHDLKLVAPTEAAALLQSNLTGSWEVIAVRVEPEAPHRIVDVGAPSRELPLPPSGVGALTDAERVQALGEFTSRVAGADVFSGVVLLAKDDSVLFLRAYGDADKERSSPNQTDTRFALASITKMFTAVAIAQLVEQGKLSFEDPLSKYLPDFRNEEAIAKVRLKHLLSHTSGIPDNLRICQRVQPCPEHPRTLDDYVTRVELAQADTLMFEPGTRWAYNNAGYVLLGKIVEIVSGQPYPDYVHENVLRPAGMRDTEFFQSGLVAERLAKRYEKEFTDEGIRFRDPDWTTAVAEMGGPSSGAYGTAEDLLRFARALQAGKLVSPQTLQLISSPKPDLGAPSWGYGVALGPAEGFVGHGGTAAGASNSLDVFQHSGHTAVVLSNYSYARTLPREHIWSLIPDP